MGLRPAVKPYIGDFHSGYKGTSPAMLESPTTWYKWMTKQQHSHWECIVVWTPRKRLLARLLADFSRETPRERLLGAGGEGNNQPDNNNGDG